MVGRRRVALALGSGGARGYAHIGVIRVLEERGLELATIAGSSMGALVGGVHAAGKLEDYTDWAQSLRQRDVVRLLDLSLSSPGVIRAEKILARVRELLGDTTIEELAIPYTAVATDLLTGREVWFQKGPLDKAIRASIAIPGVITPLMLNGRLLADGGVTNPVPIAPTSGVHTDLTIAVSLAGEDASGAGGAVQETAESRPVEEWTDRFRASASHLLGSDVIRTLLRPFGKGSHPAEDLSAEDIAHAEAQATAVLEELGAVEALPAGLGKFEMMNRSLETMQSVLIRYRSAGYPPDVLITVPRDACRIVDFHRAAEMIELGRSLAGEALDRAGIASPADRSSPVELDVSEGKPRLD
ncbi:MAG: patatin-like phospholipase family protein [Acidimicrobiales bacterium]